MELEEDVCAVERVESALPDWPPVPAAPASPGVSLAVPGGVPTALSTKPVDEFQFAFEGDDDDVDVDDVDEDEDDGGG
jgi:hypothetical protein